MAGRKKKKTGSTKPLEEVMDDTDGMMSDPPEDPPVSHEPPSAPKVTSRPSADAVLLSIYFASKGVRKDHQPGMVAYAEQKHGVNRRTTKKTFEEWDGIFSSY